MIRFTSALLIFFLLLLQASERHADKNRLNGDLRKIQHSTPNKLRHLQKHRKHKRILNKNKKKYRRKSRFEDTSSNQSYDCDIYGYTKAASVSRTQYSRTKRIQKFAPKLDRFSSQAKTVFDTTIALMNMATQNGTKCQGSPLNTTGVEVYTILSKCKVSIPTICNLSLVSSFNHAINRNISVCQPLLKTFGNTFKVCWIFFFVNLPRTLCSNILGSNGPRFARLSETEVWRSLPRNS